MTTALTGSLGWTGLHPVQLGGPPLIHSWTRPIAAKAGPLGAPALPLMAHAYLNDGVTPAATATFAVLSRPSLKATTANGGYGPVTLDVAAPIPSLVQGNVIRLTEAGGPWKGFVYGGVIESFPDVRSPGGTTHQIAVTPFGMELTRVACQLLYTAPTDVAQIVRDAVATTKHCSCDQVSVPPTTGFMASLSTSGQVDFRGQTVNQVLDTCRSIAGPTWFWFCDELGRVWFQPQGSAAGYTFMAGQHYEERSSNGGDIQDRKNQVPAVGGVPEGGSANITAVANGASQSTIGIRTLDPPIQVPGITDQATLTAIAAGVLATLDQVWTRVQLKGLPPTGQANERHPGRVHGSQPGGAVIRYWEPTKNPLPESAVGAGYVGPFVCQSIDYDGLYQQIEAGSIPVTSSADVDNLVASLASRNAVNALQVTAAALNLQQQVLSGAWQSGTGQVATSTTILPASLWRLDQSMLQVFDPNGIARVQEGNLPANGISPAQWGFRVNDASGVPILDSLGLTSPIAVLGQSFFANNQAIGPGVLTQQSVTGSPVTFSLSRPGRVLTIMMLVFNCNGNFAYGNSHLDGSDGGAGTINHHTVISNGLSYANGTHARLDTPAAGSHTIEWKLDVDAGITATIIKGWVLCLQLGS